MNRDTSLEVKLTEALTAQGDFMFERLDHWAEVSGEKTFIYYGEDDMAISYADFARRSDAIAGNLVRLGIHKGDRVSVLSKNVLVSTLVMFGIWKAGAVYCPINFAFTGRLLSYQLNDTKPKLVITDGHLLPVVNEVAETLEEKPSVAVYNALEGAHDYLPEPPEPHALFPVIGWDDLTQDCAAPGVSLVFDDPANLIYTSGTTGPAKGVLQPHRWMVSYIFGLSSMVTRDDVIYNDLPMYHVGGAIANVCRAAWVGCEVAAWNRFSPDEFWGRIEQRGATTAILLDVMIPWLTKKPARDDDRRNSLNKVHMQPLSLQHHEFATRFGIDFVSSGFGQTESGASFWTVMEETAEGDGTPAELYRGYSHVQIREICQRHDMLLQPGAGVNRKGLMGKPMQFVEVSVRDENDMVCPPEVVGQLALRPRVPGILMHGYLGKAEATVSAFRNLWFHTGDAVLQGEDGQYYFVDRMGDRIRVRGENLSSFQVEDMINQHPGVQMCAALSVPSREGDEDEVVVFVVAMDAALDEKAIHDFAADTMPKYMRPAHVRIIADLPRTPTNKVEKYKLRKLITEEMAKMA
ncbi:class I adenylate-forming enzyme family protein [Defluviimonas salinarum]|uniref:AMP-binding protein n=1 Tax=Defluviimonas salinarum TaxID=2992147 RepID=A0ABT3J7I1_9RHOB|nr:AMP-binding protein [Defluviimonas salinarum]MCW3783651.1 AMP-binding protein [Defluviimonas salinarum]